VRKGWEQAHCPAQHSPAQACAARVQLAGTTMPPMRQQTNRQHGTCHGRGAASRQGRVGQHWRGNSQQAAAGGTCLSRLPLMEMAASHRQRRLHQLTPLQWRSMACNAREGRVCWAPRQLCS
jgi:hypothetical protein